jgi:hypothetical protein
MQITHQVNYPTHERWRQQCDDVGAHAIACDEILIRASANTARFESFMDRRETFFHATSGWIISTFRRASAASADDA